MSRVTSILVAPPGKVRAGSSAFHHIIFIVFIALLLLGSLTTAGAVKLPASSDWTNAFLVVTAAATTVVSLSRQLPVQNVLLAATIIAAIAGTAQAIGVLSGIPFGPYFYTESAGPKIFNVLPWSVPIVWIIVLLNARGVARLILRPWRKNRLYGFRLIGVTAVLTLVFVFGLETYATQVNRFWLWQPTKFALWQGTPPSNFLGWLVTALLVLAFATPVMINKSHQKFPSDYHPLIVWILLSALFAIAAATHHLWIAAGIIAVMGVVVTGLSIHGARW
jgi:uncharacterized membrane protein